MTNALKARLCALVMSCALTASPALADPSVGVSFTIGAHPSRSDAARCVNPTRITMYGGQVADALTAGAAVSHGGVSRTPFGGSPAVTYLLEQGVLDMIVGAVTRRTSCGTKNTVNAIIGGSAVINSFENSGAK